MEKVLFIDDDEIQSFIVSNLFRRASIEVNLQSFLNGKEAIDYLESCSPEAFPEFVFVDLNMPVMDGFEFISRFEKKFSAKFNSTKVYVLSSSIRDDDKEKTMAYSFVKDFISKPISADVLKGIFG